MSLVYMDVSVAEEDRVKENDLNLPLPPEVKIPINVV